MADKPEKKPEAPAPAATEKKEGGKAAGGGGLLSKTPVIMGVIMVVEAVILFAGFKFIGGGPKAAAGAETAAEQDGGGEHGDGHDGHGGEGKAKAPEAKKKWAEVPVLEHRFTNAVSGRTLLFDIEIRVRVKGENEEAVKQKIADNKGLITDRIGTIMRQSDPQKLGGGSEPGLETLRRQIKYQLDEALGEGMVEEVLVPGCIPFRAEF